jgi:RNA polymerase sigma-54 factor
VKQSLGFKLSQNLALTPQLQQSIKLLQLSTLELNEEIERALLDNPLLERLDDPQAALAVSLSSSGRLLDGTAPASRDAGMETGAMPGSAGDKEAAPDNAGDSASDNSDAYRDDWASDSGMSWGNNRGGTDGNDDDDDRDGRQLAGQGTTLREHLIEQARSTTAGPRDRLLLALLIDALDANGYLPDELDEMVESAARLLDETPSEDLADDLRCALKLLQSFDPAGVGARNASECLALQILYCDAKHPLRQVPKRVAQLALTLVRHHLPLVAARDFVRIRRLIKVDEETLKAAHAAIKTLTPHPGARFAQTESNYIFPDVVVSKGKNGWVVSLNQSVMPKLSINDAYAQVLKQQRKTMGEAGAGLQARLQEARWLIKNIEQRFDTILRVSTAIVERQKAFFTHGEVAMRPLVLREIADQLGLHESTISRVTTQKFMLTPMGTFELKYFFGSSLATDTGGAASSTAIRALIRQLVAAENPQTPLSDSKIAELLMEQGVVVARRTVAKYREAMKIAQVHMRKSL